MDSSPGTWLADLGTQEGMPCVLGHALSMNALHGDKATHDKIDAHNIAVLLRGGVLPQASVYPADRRATRDLRQRRLHVVRHRAELLPHVPHTNRQDTLPESGQKIADKATRDGGVERCPDPAVQKRLAVDLALMGHSDALLRELEWAIVTTAPPHDAHTLYVLQTVPGIGKILRLVLLDDRHAIARFPRGQAVVSDGRVVTGAQASAGKRDGPSGTTIGHASRTWAFAAAAVLFLRTHPAGHTSLGR